ncbi:hypothetical protein [Cupriavidus basilensis]|uniref:hypothetical protein n=1 Tax=Cupriavidus basilensis TaxID=68895 RepID=UPI00157A7195|nr:hypothetical protein [Cupriavidus basilensis]NUA30186.1 hypothetical protein [Cupriavidus basilensis]
MRDVTDKRTAELPVGDAKRGRGRPRKANALSNAERQAAYRARHRKSVTARVVTEMQDSMEGSLAVELYEELDAVRAELAEAHETIDEMTSDRAAFLETLAGVNCRVEQAEEERNKAFAAVDKLQAELDATRKADTVPAKAYAQLQLDVVALRKENEYLEGRLAGIDNAPALNLVLSLIRQACTHLTDAKLRDLSCSSEVVDLAGFNLLSLDQYRELVEILNPKAVAKKTVTRKAVTKKGA